MFPLESYMMCRIIRAGIDRADSGGRQFYRIHYANPFSPPILLTFLLGFHIFY